jgi:hypothetical protein
MRVVDKALLSVKAKPRWKPGRCLGGEPLWDADQTETYVSVIVL